MTTNKHRTAIVLAGLLAFVLPSGFVGANEASSAATPECTFDSTADAFEAQTASPESQAAFDACGIIEILALLADDPCPPQAGAGAGAWVYQDSPIGRDPPVLFYAAGWEYETTYTARTTHGQVGCYFASFTCTIQVAPLGDVYTYNQVGYAATGVLAGDWHGAATTGGSAGCWDEGAGLDTYVLGLNTALTYVGGGTQDLST